MSIHVSMVSIPVKDQEKSLKFYTEKLGFQVVTDAPFGDGCRWIELAPQTGNTRIALFCPPGHESRIGTFSNIVFSTDDVQKTYEKLSRLGVEFTELPKKQPWGGTTALFKDIDGNTFCLSSE